MTIALKYITAHPNTIWYRYFSNFINHNLHIDIAAFPVSREVICAFFSKFLEKSPLHQLAYLYVYVDYYRIKLANICSFLHPLEKIWEATTEYPPLLESSGSFPAKEFIKSVRESKHPFGDPQKMSSFVISGLFSALVGIVHSQWNKKEDKGKSYIQSVHVLFGLIITRNM